MVELLDARDTCWSDWCIEEGLVGQTNRDRPLTGLTKTAMINVILFLLLVQLTKEEKAQKCTSKHTYAINRYKRDCDCTYRLMTLTKKRKIKTVLMRNNSDSKVEFWIHEKKILKIKLETVW